jgi:hypothetical protein
MLRWSERKPSAGRLILAKTSPADDSLSIGSFREVEKSWSSGSALELLTLPQSSIGHCGSQGQHDAYRAETIAFVGDFINTGVEETSG